MSSLLVFNRVHRLEIQSVMMVFSTSIVNWRPSNLLTGLTLPPPFPVLIFTGVGINTVCNGGGGDGIRLGREHLQELYIHCVFDQIPLLYYPKKDLGEEGASDR
jgi:hypothetical protein